MESSPLSKISAELRNQIYELVLVHEHPIRITANDYTSDIRAINFLPHSHPLALLRTCKQINGESTTFFYGSNTFHFGFAGSAPDKDKDELCLVQRFCAMVGETALLGLRDLHVHVPRRFQAPESCRWAEALKIHSRNLLGLRGVQVLNDGLKIRYTFEVAVTSRWIGDWVMTPYVALKIEDLENTLDAAITLLGEMMFAGGAASINELIRRELRLFQQTTFGNKLQDRGSVLLMDF